jgi:carbon monoxide dehydrogenase subunit G
MQRLLFAFLSATVLISCQSISGSGNIITEVRNYNEFTGIKNSGSIDVQVMQTESKEIKVEADDNVMQYVITKIEDGILHIYLKEKLSYRNINVRVFVNTPLMQNLSVTGSGTIMSKNVIKDKRQIEMKVSGSGEINLNIETPSVIATISGSGNIRAQGRTKNFNCKISGSGELMAKNLLSENTNIKVSGSGNAHVFSSIKLNATVSGSGDINYSGNPSSPQIHKSGSGSVQPGN